MHQLAQRVQDTFPVGFVSSTEWRGDVSVTVTREKVHEVAQFLHDDPGMDFDYIVHVSPSTGPMTKRRSGLGVYRSERQRIRLKTRPESIVSSLPHRHLKGADFMERV